MKNIIIVLSLVALVVITTIFLIIKFEKPGYEKTEISYGGVDFLITSWGDFPHDTRFNWYCFDEGKKKLMLKGTANGHPSVEFSLQWTTNGASFANLFGNYFCVDGIEVTVFDWQKSSLQEELFIGYFHWILDSKDFWECLSVASGMHHWWNDPQAKAYLGRVMTEDPKSDFFPNSVGETWLKKFKEILSEQLNENPNQALQPTVKTPAELGNQQRTAAEF